MVVVMVVVCVAVVNVVGDVVFAFAASVLGDSLTCDGTATECISCVLFVLFDYCFCF